MFAFYNVSTDGLEVMILKAVRKTVDMIAVFRAGEIPEPIRFRFRDRMGKETVIKVGMQMCLIRCIILLSISWMRF